MKNVYLAQVNNTYGKGAFLPFSVGLLAAYALDDSIIRKHYNFKEFLFLREPIESAAERWQDADIVGLSCYIWNMNYTMALAREIRTRNKKCLIVCGGPHVPDNSYEFLENNSYIDILVHGEGEQTFLEILQNHLIREIDGISWYDRYNHKVVKNSPRERLRNLDSIPSPYLTGLFDNFPFDKYEFHPTQETHRGCPFSCSFCDWGSATYGKVTKFSDERIIKEYEWMANKKLDLLYNADANYGQFERDVLITEALARTKERFGFPKKFRAAYAKNSGERVYQISKILNDAGMSKGATLSFQSMDEHTLEVVKRKNIGTEVFKMLMQRYRKENIPTYSELIIGLPGESYNSFANGINTILDCGQHEGINVYLCECLPNSELSQPEYRELHGIRSVEVPVLVYHGTPSEDKHQEKYELVTQTNTLSTDDWIKCQQLAWAVQCFHCLGLTQIMALYYVNRYKQSYRMFYENLIDFASTYKPEETLIGQLLTKVTNGFKGILQGRSWGIIDDRFGNIIWPPEEGSYLKISAESRRFYEELYHWFPNLEVLQYQEAVSKTFDGPRKISLSWDIPSYLGSVLNGDKDISIIPIPCTYKVLREKYVSLEQYAKDVVWYGRKGGKFTCEVEFVPKDN